MHPAFFPDLYTWISKIHLPIYTNHLKAIIPKAGQINLDPDTTCSPGSLFSAESAVAGVLTAIDGIMDQNIQNAFCAIRPPGHHAEPDHAMGFCLFNNIAIGARYLQLKYHLKKILILDWDVHHGNGTQHAFYDDPSVFYFSTHQFPCYPGTGSLEERGIGMGEGLTQNYPLRVGAGDSELLNIFERELAKAVSSFKPDFILISAGFDAHQEDPLASLEVTDTGFEEMTKIVHSLALTHCGGRIVSCLEGGYHLEALARSVQRHLTVLSAPQRLSPPFK